MRQHDRLLRSLIALAVMAAIAGCGGVAPKGPAESGSGQVVSAPETPANNVAVSDPNQTVSRPADPQVGTTAPGQAVQPSGTGVAPAGETTGNAGPNSVPASPPATQPPMTGALSFSTMNRGSSSGVTGRSALLITDVNAWNSHWAKHAAIMMPAPQAPAVDFSQQSVLAVYMGEQRSGGYSVEVTGVQQQNGKLMVTVKQTRPGPGSMTTMALTQPFHIISIPKMPAGTTVEVKWQ